MKLDFPVTRTIEVSNQDDLREAIVSHDHIRLAGSGSTQLRIPAPREGVTMISLSGMNRILRLEADDLTCSVEPGVRREDLDSALDENGLCLPCAGEGTIGGIFASDEMGPVGPGQPEPRALLLGFSGCLSDGTRFRSGSRVVKNVAGLDLSKLFVGSRGRLFAVTAMHLKVRRQPRATLDFHRPSLELDAALDLLSRLRNTTTVPAVLQLEMTSDGFAISGKLTGHGAVLQQCSRSLGLTPGSGPTTAGRDDAHETLRGQVPCGKLASLIEGIPPRTAFTLVGHRFALESTPEAVDGLLARLPLLGGWGEIVGGSATRRGRTTPNDTASEQLCTKLKEALDPRGALL